MFVKLYSAGWCGSCESVKQRLSASGIPYEVVDVDKPSVLEELSKQGVRAVPYLHAENAVGSEYKALGNAINVNSLKTFLGE